jgi:hypothetical protein
MLIPYLDKDGYLITADKKPVFVRNFSRGISCIRAAKYVRCKKEKVQGLIWIGHCEKCEYFGGHVRYKGIKCNVKKIKTPKQ